MLRILEGDAIEGLRKLPSGLVQCCVTSPPYWGLRDYGVEGQLGLEETPNQYVAKMVEVFREVWRVLRDDGTLWVNLGDSYVSAGGGGEARMAELHGERDTDFRRGILFQGRSGKRPYVMARLKPKDLVGIPWRVAFALQADGWYLRSDIIWAKPNPMPESVSDRPTKAHEYLFLLSKSERYYYDAEAIKEPNSESTIRTFGESFLRTEHPGCAPERNDSGFGGTNCCGVNPNSRNKRSVWSVPTAPYPEAHFATYPPDLIKPCILAGTKAGDIVLDPFAGSGTTGMVALELGRRAVLIELNPAYLSLIEERCAITPGLAL